MHDGQKKVTFNGKQYRVLEPDTYRVKLVAVNEKPGRFGDLYVPTFQIMGDRKFKGCELNDLINKSETKRNSKLWRFVRALSNKEYGENESLNLDDLIGKECYVDVLKQGRINKITEYITVDDLKDVKRLDR